MHGLIPGAPARAVAANCLTDAHRLDRALSDNPTTVADRVTRGLPGGEQQRRRNVILRALLNRLARLQVPGDTNGKHNQNRDDSDQLMRAFTGILADRNRACGRRDHSSRKYSPPNPPTFLSVIV